MSASNSDKRHNKAQNLTSLATQGAMFIQKELLDTGGYYVQIVSTALMVEITVFLTQIVCPQGAE